jgi:hypothetical protein
MARKFYVLKQTISNIIEGNAKNILIIFYQFCVNFILTEGSERNSLRCVGGFERYATGILLHSGGFPIAQKLERGNGGLESRPTSPCWGRNLSNTSSKYKTNFSQTC